MLQTRRQFLKNMSLMGAICAMPNWLVAKEKGAEDITQWKMTGSHWGAIRAKVENGCVVDVKPFELDKYPTEMINGIKGLI